jgi:hypothetical protein
MIVPFCMYNCSAWWEACVQSYGVDVVYGISPFVMGRQCISLWWCRCECIYTVRLVKPVYILMEVGRVFISGLSDVKPVYILMDVLMDLYAFLPCVMWSQCTSLWWCRWKYICDVSDVKPVYILMLLPLFMHFRRTWCEASVLPYACAVVHPFTTCVMSSLCTFLRWCGCEFISAARKGKQVYILMMVPLCMHFRSW